MAKCTQTTLPQDGGGVLASPLMQQSLQELGIKRAPTLPHIHCSRRGGQRVGPVSGLARRPRDVLVKTIA